jgi:hypothetical protein
MEGYVHTHRGDEEGDWRWRAFPMMPSSATQKAYEWVGTSRQGRSWMGSMNSWGPYMMLWSPSSTTRTIGMLMRTYLCLRRAKPNTSSPPLRKSNDGCSYEFCTMAILVVSAFTDTPKYRCVCHHTLKRISHYDRVFALHFLKSFL